MQIARNVCYRKAIFGKAKKQVFRLEHLLSILKAIFRVIGQNVRFNLFSKNFEGGQNVLIKNALTLENKGQNRV